uniref:Protein ripply3 n=1 Tax=Apteryx owenii TaxID=8824 RepID=A0A8B9QKI8_APTOW
MPKATEVTENQQYLLVSKFYCKRQHQGTPGFFSLQRKEKIDHNTQARLVAKDSHSFTFSFKTCFLIRLYLPRSKSQKFLSNIGEKVLASFPVQATIHFYNDDIDSEEDEEEINEPTYQNGGFF